MKPAGGLIELPVMLPDGRLATLWWPSDRPLPESFTLVPKPDEDGVYQIGVPQS
jgi:hypothetical protein